MYIAQGNRGIKETDYFIIIYSFSILYYVFVYLITLIIGKKLVRILVYVALDLRKYRPGINAFTLLLGSGISCLVCGAIF